MQITVHSDQDAGPLAHFWRSTGFSPASLLLNADMRQQMTYAASTNGIDHVRIHYLLDLVRGTGFGTDAVQYDWSALDTALDVLVENNLRPFFELMGNPSGYFTDFTDDAQLHAWRRLVRDLALHYIERYGLETVRSWYFETWNEPDAWWEYGEQGFMNYYDACSEGLREADPQIRFGGPGTCRTLSSLFKAFIAHCDTGTNYFTGETGLRLDFISVHEKGAPSSREDLTPDTAKICHMERAAIEHIRAHHPRLGELPFMNNECDPQVGWKHYHTWRALPYYSGIVCRMINQHVNHLSDVNYTILSNDNGFVGEWGNRTLTARFGEIEDSRAQSEHQTQEADLRENPERRKFEMIKKPVLTVMALLNLLGDQRCVIDGVGDADDPVGVIATRRGDSQVAILVYHSRDRFYADGEATIDLRLQKLPFEEAMLAHYRLDETHGNPFAAWAEGGGKRYPHIPAETYQQMRRDQEPTLYEPVRPITGDHLGLNFTLPLTGVSLILLSARTPDDSAPARRLRLTPYEAGIIIAWDADPRFIQTYEVGYSNSADGPFERINPVDTICTAYLHTDPPEAGFYRVRTIDYWGRASDSEPIAIGD